MFVISRPLLSTPLRSRKTAKVVGGQRNEEAMGVKDESCLWVDLTAVTAAVLFNCMGQKRTKMNFNQKTSEIGPISTPAQIDG